MFRGISPTTMDTVALRKVASGQGAPAKGQGLWLKCLFLVHLGGFDRIWGVL